MVALGAANATKAPCARPSPCTWGPITEGYDADGRGSGWDERDKAVTIRRLTPPCF